MAFAHPSVRTPNLVLVARLNAILVPHSRVQSVGMHYTLTLGRVIYDRQRRERQRKERLTAR
jgi:hypothetical protein